MKIGSKLQFEIPDKCPENCVLKPVGFYQGCICTRCPVFCCEEPKTKKDEMYMPLVPAIEYRDDWAEEWVIFFKNGLYPKLKFECNK